MDHRPGDQQYTEGSRVKTGKMFPAVSKLSNFETFAPAVSKFDCLIINEATQVDVMSLTPLYMADQGLVVCDAQPVSLSGFRLPSRVFCSSYRGLARSGRSLNVH